MEPWNSGRPEKPASIFLPSRALVSGPPPSYVTKLTSLGSIPVSAASCIGNRWSGPPGDDPPPTASEPGSAFQASRKSSTVSNGESPGTRIPSGSLISWAIGVASLRPNGLAKEYVEPTTPSPTVISVCSSPTLPTSSVIATAPPAPTTFVTVMSPPVMSSSSSTCTASRPVRS